MQIHTPHAPPTQTAIGYVKVSTQEQVTAGVSLDTQRDRIRAYNQFDRELISERMRDAMQHMKAQGSKLGPAPYGYEFARQLDDN